MVSEYYCSRSKTFPLGIIEASLGRFHRTCASLTLNTHSSLALENFPLENYSHSIVAFGFGDIS